MIRWLKEERDLDVVGIAMNGREGVSMAKEQAPDVLILDVEMPELDGLGAIPGIVAASPRTKILMASTLTRRNAEVTLKALSLGAADYLPKPETGRIAAAADFKRDLLARVRALGQRRIPAAARPATATAANVPAPAPAPTARISLRPMPKQASDIIVIGCSTGGPQALQTVIAGLAGRTQLPILIVQHMPPMFTAILAEQLSKLSTTPTAEAKEGMPIKPGHIYVAPGDFHMRIVKRHGASVIALDQTPPVNFCRPAVDPLFASAAEVYGARVTAAVLTGMGQDGKRGADIVTQKGGAVLAQDEASSVVWGMPGAVATGGFACCIRPLPEIAAAILALSQGRTP
jgi:two-component system chemotaxis response regulator CheB